MQFHAHAVHVEHYMKAVTSLLNAAGSQQLVLLWVVLLFCFVFTINCIILSLDGFLVSRAL